MKPKIKSIHLEYKYKEDSELSLETITKILTVYKATINSQPGIKRKRTSRTTKKKKEMLNRITSSSEACYNILDNLQNWILKENPEEQLKYSGKKSTMATLHFNSNTVFPLIRKYYRELQHFPNIQLRIFGFLPELLLTGLECVKEKNRETK